jgi:hypothetical protein
MTTRTGKIGPFFLNWTKRKKGGKPFSVQWHRHNRSVYALGITFGWLNLRYL